MATKPNKKQLKSTKRPRPVKASQPSFLILPAEVRNMIYHLTLVAEDALEIRDLPLSDFKRSKRSGKYRLRSTYSAPDHACKDCNCRPRSHYGYLSHIDSCFCDRKEDRFEKTTYILHKTGHTKNLMLTLLSLNRQVGLEAASVFYGINTFSFSTMSSVIPFFKDRAPESRQLILNIQLVLSCYASDWYSITTAYNRPDTWKRVFTSLGRLQHLSLKTIDIVINDEFDQMYVHDLYLETKHMQWLHSLSKITNLEKLGVTYDYASNIGLWADHYYYAGLPPRIDRDSQTEPKIWAFLAPRMLKAPGDDFNALLERRMNRRNVENADGLRDETADTESNDAS